MNAPHAQIHSELQKEVGERGRHRQTGRCAYAQTTETAGYVKCSQESYYRQQHKVTNKVACTVRKGKVKLKLFHTTDESCFASYNMGKWYDKVWHRCLGTVLTWALMHKTFRSSLVFHSVH